MGDIRPWLLNRWQRALGFLDLAPSPPPELPTQLLAEQPPAPVPDRHELSPSRAVWHVTQLVEVIPGSGGRRWKPGTVQTQLMPAATPDAAEARPGWPK